MDQVKQNFPHFYWKDYACYCYISILGWNYPILPRYDAENINSYANFSLRLLKVMCTFNVSCLMYLQYTVALQNVKYIFSYITLFTLKTSWREYIWLFHIYFYGVIGSSCLIIPPYNRTNKIHQITHPSNSKYIKHTKHNY